MFSVSLQEKCVLGRGLRTSQLLNSDPSSAFFCRLKGVHGLGVCVCSVVRHYSEKQKVNMEIVWDVSLKQFRKKCWRGT